jgi:hypothetical protein
MQPAHSPTCICRFFPAGGSRSDCSEPATLRATEIVSNGVAAQTIMARRYQYERRPAVLLFEQRMHIADYRVGDANQL